MPEQLLGLRPQPASTKLMDAVNWRWGAQAQELPASARRDAKLIYWKMCMKQGCAKHTDKFTGKMKEFGWVTVGPAQSGDPHEYTRMITSKHWTPLPQYGRMDYGESVSGKGIENRWKLILEMGGIIEFPEEQLVAYNWDLIPEVLEARPDIKQHPRVECKLGGCVNRRFASDDDLRTHTAAVHKEVESTQSIANAMKETRGSNADLALLIANAITAAIPEIIRAGMTGAAKAQKMPAREAALSAGLEGVGTVGPMTMQIDSDDS